MRFAVAGPSKTDNRGMSADDLSHAPAVIRVMCVCERNHRPVQRGDLEYDLQRSQWLQRHDDARLQKMAECFLESFLKKKS